jgi:protein TonB
MKDQKKTAKADLESKKVFFLEFGLIIALAITLLAFEWKSYEKQKIELLTRVADDTPEEMIEITQQDKTPPPPAPPQQTTIIQIVEDDVEIEDDIEIDVEADQNTEVKEYVPVEVNKDEEAEEVQIFTVVESMPSFPGGEAARIQYLNDNIKYPQMARESGIQGRVFVTFVVEKNGSVTDVKVLRGIGGGCDEEAIRVIQNMPKWEPGKQRGKPVRVQFNMPILFKLN